MLIVDGAGWHSSPKLAVPENIVLLKLPRYASELNPAENIWEYLRGNALSHQIWETYDAIVDACCDAWNGLMRSPEIVAGRFANPCPSRSKRALASLQLGIIAFASKRDGAKGACAYLPKNEAFPSTQQELPSAELF